MTATTAVDFPGVIYMIHFDEPFKHAKHYIGWTSDLNARLTEHARGTGGRLLRVIKDAGIGWVVARTWIGDRNQERKLKNWGVARNGRCPVCRGDLPQYAAGAVPFASEESS